MSSKDDKRKAIQQAIQELMDQVEEMPIGGNLMKLLDEEIPKLNRRIVEASTERREEINQAHQGSFSPSGSLPEVWEDGESDERG